MASLKLVARDDSEPPPLSPARMRLAAVLVECRKAAALRARIEQARHELAQATEVETGVHKRLDDLARDERAEWDEWAAGGGSGARPSPRTEQRAELTLALTDAATLRCERRNAIDALVRGHESLFGERAAQLARQRDAALVAVLLDEAVILSERRAQLMQDEMVLAHALGVLRDKLAAMRTPESWSARSKIADMLRVTVGRLDQLGQSTEPRRREIGEAYASLIQRLADDHLARVADSDFSPEPGDAA